MTFAGALPQSDATTWSGVAWYRTTRSGLKRETRVIIYEGLTMARYLRRPVDAVWSPLGLIVFERYMK